MPTIIPQMAALNTNPKAYNFSPSGPFSRPGFSSHEFDRPFNQF